MAVRVHRNRADIHEVTNLDEDAVLLHQLQPFGEGRQEPRRLDHDIRAGPARRQSQHGLLALPRVGHGPDIDRLMRAQFAGKLQASPPARR